MKVKARILVSTVGPAADVAVTTSPIWTGVYSLYIRSLDREYLSLLDSDPGQVSVEDLQQPIDEMIKSNELGYCAESSANWKMRVMVFLVMNDQEHQQRRRP
jgi:hypothetical protein